MNHVDTAAFYFSQHSAANLIIREALAPYPDDLVIVTKVGPRRAPDGDVARLGAARRTSAPTSSATSTELGLDRLEVVNYRSNGRDDVPAAVAALAALRDEGLLRHVGLSNVDAATLEAALAGHRHRLRPEPPRPGLRARRHRRRAGGLRGARDRLRPVLHIAGRARESAAEEPYDVVRAIADAHGATPPRCGSPGPSRSVRTCSPSPAPATRRTSRERRRGLPPAHRRRPGGPRDARLTHLNRTPPPFRRGRE